jgi:hypothetical protein
VVWDGVLLDGHNRYDICTKHGIKFKTVERNCKDRDDAKQFIFQNQLGRRNLTTSQRAMLVAENEKLVASLAAAAKASYESRRKRMPGGSYPEPSKKPAVHTDKVLAQVARVGHGTMAQTRVLVREAPEPIKAALRAGETTINREYQKLKAKKPTATKKAASKKQDDVKRARTAFLLHAGAARNSAVHPGIPITQHILDMARSVVTEWAALVTQFEKEMK